MFRHISISTTYPVSCSLFLDQMSSQRQCSEEKNYAKNPFSLLGQIWSLFSRNAFSSIPAADTCSVCDCHHPWACQRPSILRHCPGSHPCFPSPSLIFVFIHILDNIHFYHNSKVITLLFSSLSTSVSSLRLIPGDNCLDK